MNAFEKLVDSMGQAIFRVETNFETVQRSLLPGPAVTDASQAITDDIERLKAAKVKLAKGPIDDMVAACEMIMGVKYCMMFHHIHDEQSAKEILAKYGANHVQHLANKAQATAERALKAWEEINK